MNEEVTNSNRRNNGEGWRMIKAPLLGKKKDRYD